MLLKAAGDGANRPTALPAINPAVLAIVAARGIDDFKIPNICVSLLCLLNLL